MLAVQIPTVVNAATGNNGYVTVISHIEVIVYHLGQTTLTEDNGDVDTFFFRAWFDDNINPLLVGFRHNVDMCRGGTGNTRSIGSDIVSSFRHLVKTGDLFQQIFLYFIHKYHLPF